MGTLTGVATRLVHTQGPGLMANGLSFTSRGPVCMTNYMAALLSTAVRFLGHSAAFLHG